MEYTTLKPCQEISAIGVIYEKGSLYEHFHNLNDPRRAERKRDWARNHADELARLLGLGNQPM